MSETRATKQARPPPRLPRCNRPAACPSQERAGQPDQVRPAGRDFISPVVARMVAEHAIDLAQIAGTGLGGRVTRRDVELHLATQPALADLPAAEEPAPAVELELGDVLAPLTTMRRVIAQHMVHEQADQPPRHHNF
jgi:pyruvate/2-oxoglutarate dehydrogenase complex dihydrolipoamide acyltransferase (E2) component